MRVVPHREAEAELTAALERYEQWSPGLGRDFLDEFEAGIQRIREHPEAWPVLRGEARRYLLRRFPFGLVYAIRPGEIYLIAVMHLKRRPFYWKDRV